MANRNDTLVTGSHAIFHKEGNKNASAAVVGFQFRHSAMFASFRNTTSNCADASCLNCASDDFECFVLDENGYVVISPELSDTGKFFGEVRSLLMNHLYSEKVYKNITIYDYQAVCFVGKDSLSYASKLLTVEKSLKYFQDLFLTFSFSAFQTHLGAFEDCFKIRCVAVP